MFGQDYRINKIFLPFRKKGKKHYPLFEGRRSLIVPTKYSCKGKKHPLLISHSFFPLKRNYVFTASSGSREKNQVNPVNPVDKHQRLFNMAPFF